MKKTLKNKINLFEVDERITKIVRDISWTASSVGSDMSKFGGQIQHANVDPYTDLLLLKQRLAWLKKAESVLGKLQDEHFALFLKRR